MGITRNGTLDLFIENNAVFDDFTQNFPFSNYRFEGVFKRNLIFEIPEEKKEK